MFERAHATQSAFLQESSSRLASEDAKCIQTVDADHDFIDGEEAMVLLQQSATKLPAIVAAGEHPALTTTRQYDPFGREIGEIVSDWGVQGVVLLLVVIVSGVISICSVCCTKKSTQEEDIFLYGDADVLRLYSNDDIEAKKPASTCSCWYCSSITICSLLFVASVLLLLALLFSGRFLKQMIEHYDVAFLGVQVHLNELDVNPFAGVVSAEGLTIFNPSGWKTDHLLTASSIYIKLNMLDLMYSLVDKMVVKSMLSVDVEELLVKGVNVVYEKSLHTSNVYEVLEHVKEALHTNRSSPSNITPESSGLLNLQKVAMLDVTAKAALYGVGGVNLVVPSITENNFSQKIGSDHSVSFVVDLLLDMLLTNVLRALSHFLGPDVVAAPDPAS